MGLRGLVSQTIANHSHTHSHLKVELKAATEPTGMFSNPEKSQSDIGTFYPGID